MRILVTGGAGYIGTEVVRKLSLRNDNSEVIVYDNLSRPNYNLFISREKLEKNIRFVQGEILDTRSLKKALEQVDVVIHCAARVISPFSDQMSHSFEQVNHWGTAELVYAMEELDVPHLIHISSSSVYGSSHKLVGAGDATNPKTFYGISKKRAEDHALRLMSKGIKTHILRCGNVYGFSKSMRIDTVINKMLFDAHFKGRISVHGSGEQYRAFIHIDTLSGMIADLVSNDLESGTYDLVENNYSVNDIAKTLKGIYPKLEMLFIDQNMKMREIQVRPDERLCAELQTRTGDLRIDLQAFRENFTF